ncbi:MAG: transposase, partial [Halobacteriovoraceae bacterium]|nr:transposase [Halobacteriovoraceae bacterium]
LKKHPHLNEMYHAKEALQCFYRIKGYEKASVAIDKMIERFRESKTKEVKRLGNTLKYWRQEVLNYFRKRLTNARLEGFNNKASLVRRRAYGYKNPNNYRLRLLSVCG